MASDAERYGIGIGGGALSGAAAGSVVGPWGALVGGVIGGGIGAIGAALGGDAEEEQRKQLEQSQRDRQKQQLVGMLRNRARSYGINTDGFDYMQAKKGQDQQFKAENEAFEQANAVNPQAYVQLAQSGVQLAGGLYKAANMPTAPQGGNGMQMPDVQLAGPQNAGLGSEAAYQQQQQYPLNPQDYSLSKPGYNEYALDPRRFSLGGGGFR